MSAGRFLSEVVSNTFSSKHYSEILLANDRIFCRFLALETMLRLDSSTVTNELSQSCRTFHEINRLSLYYRLFHDNLTP